MNREIEKKFIRGFMGKARWERAEHEAASPSKRKDFHWRMHWDILPGYKHSLEGISQPEDILSALMKKGIRGDAYIMALHSEMDGRIMPAAEAVKAVYGGSLIATVYLPESDIAFAYDEFHECWLISK